MTDSGHHARGRLMMLASNACFAAMGAVVKFLPSSMSSYQKVFYRALIGLALLLAWYVPRPASLGRPNDRKMLLLRGIYGTISLICYFYAIDHIGLTKATLYCYTYPVWAAIIAWYDGSAKLRRSELACLAVALAGTVLTLGNKGWAPTISWNDAIGLVAGITSGAAITSVRKLHRTDSSTWIVIGFTAATVLMTAPLQPFVHVTPRGVEWTLLAAVGFLALCAQLLMTAAYRHLPAVEGSVMSLGTVPFSAVLAMVFLHEYPAPRFWVGAGLVFTAITVLSYWKSMKPDAELEPTA